MDDSSSEFRSLGMGDANSAVNDAILIQLTLDADRLIQGERQVRGELQPLFRDVRDLTEGCGLVLGYKTAPGHRHAKLMTLIAHWTLVSSGARLLSQQHHGMA